MSTAVHRIRLWPWLAIGAAALTILCWRLNEPWVGMTSYNASWVSSCARNLLRFSPAETGLLQVRNDGLADPSSFHFYIHHPPGITWLVAIAFRLLGRHEWAARLVPILFTLLSMGLVGWMVGRVRGRRSAFLAVALLTFMPMIGLYGRMVNHEAVTQFWILLAIERYLSWLRKGGWGALLGTALSFCAGAACGWPMYFLAGLIPAHALVCLVRSRMGGGGDGGVRPMGRRALAMMILLPACAVFMVGCTVGQIYWRTGRPGVEVLAHAFLFRSTGQGYSDFKATENFVRSGGLSLDFLETETVPSSVASVVARQTRRACIHFTPVGFLLGLAWLVLRKRGPQDPRSGESPVAAIGLAAAVGLLHITVFSQGAWAHSYWLFYLAAPLAMAGGQVLDRALELGSRRRLVWWVTIACLVAHGLAGLCVIGRNRFGPDADPADRFWQELGQALRPIAAGRTVATNLPFHGPRASYYAEADMVWAVADQESLDRAVQRGGAAWYLIDPALAHVSPEPPRVQPERDSIPLTVQGKQLELRSLAPRP